MWCPAGIWFEVKIFETRWRASTCRNPGGGSPADAAVVAIASSPAVMMRVPVFMLSIVPAKI
jgi:hypothetical protein